MDGDEVLEATLMTFEEEDPREVLEFRVDRGKRTIEGLILPWGKVATTGFSRWRFKRGSLAWSQVSRVKLLRDHEVGQPVGRAVSLANRNEGLWGRFKIRNGPEGDDVLDLAQDQILDGFSAGAIIQAEGWELDPSDRGVRLVSNATLRETTITAMPAFDDARVTHVAAMLRVNAQHEEGEGAMSGEGEGKGKKEDPTVLDTPESALEQFQQSLDERFDSVTEKLVELQTSAAEGITEIVSKALSDVFEHMAGPETEPRAKKAAANLKLVREEPVYRFDGAPRQPSMVRDFWRAQTERDPDAVERLRKFQEQQRDMVDLLYKMPVEARANVTNFVDTSDASSVIPQGYRPDLFVNELRLGRPIVSQLSRGTISDATPFVVPRFVSSGGATADHVEGTNPTPGTLTLDQVAVSPGATSGSFELTREIVDAANPAIDAIALAAMRESYNQQTEAKAYAALNGAAVVANTEGSPSAAVGADDILALRTLLARYPFSRFASPTGAVMNQASTTRLATAVDGDGRPLLASIGATNAAGLGNSLTQGWFIDGLGFLPAWAMTDATGDDVAIILNRMDAWTWESPLLTFRFEEKQGPAIIEMSLFAYYATQVLRPAGLFALRREA